MSRYHRLLVIILGFAALGTLLSGYLSYRNYFTIGCSQGPLSSIVTCGGAKAFKIFHQPTCIYGFVMFFAVFITSLIGLYTAPSQNIMRTQVALGIAGTAFSGFLVIYEIFHLKFPLMPIPACLFGLVFYLGILISSCIGLRTPRSPISSAEERP